MFTDNLFTLILTQALFLKEIFWSLNYELNICFWPLDAAVGCHISRFYICLIISFHLQIKKLSTCCTQSL